MPPVKDEKSATAPLNTSAQIQQIFSEIQSQLPSVNFDNDDQNDNDADDDNEDIFESTLPENTDALLESLSHTNTNPFLTLHPRIETPQQPPSVESQMRLSPNLFDHSAQNQASPPKPSILSMDLFNTIDFEKLPPLTPHDNHPQTESLARTFNRPRPNNPRTTTFQPQVNIKNRDDRQILDRLAQQANKFNTSERSNATREHHAFRNLESALYATTHEHGKRIGIPESERKTIYIDLRNSHVQKQDQLPSPASQSMSGIKPSSQPMPSSDSDSDDEEDDGMLWFEKRRQARKQQQSN